MCQLCRKMEQSEKLLKKKMQAYTWDTLMKTSNEAVIGLIQMVVGLGLLSQTTEGDKRQPCADQPEEEPMYQCPTRMKCTALSALLPWTTTNENIPKLRLLLGLMEQVSVLKNHGYGTLWESSTLSLSSAGPRSWRRLL